MWLLASNRSAILCACSLVLGAQPAAAQDEALVDDLARILQLEDERRYDPAVFHSVARHPDPVVRRHAALGLGRVGDPAGMSLLLELLRDPDSTVAATAAFGIGLMRDPVAVPQLANVVLEAQGMQQTGLHVEAVTALAKIGGGRATQVFRQILDRAVGRVQVEQEPIVDRVLLESWRLGDDAPLQRIMVFVESPAHTSRWPAVYALARLRSPMVASVLLRALSDPQRSVRAIAARALTREYAAAARLNFQTVAAELQRLSTDGSPEVRINALWALRTYRDPQYATVALDRLRDASFNVRVQAVATLGHLGGAEAVQALLRLLSRQRWAIRRQALLALATAAGQEFDSVAGLWATRSDWEERHAVAEAWGVRRVRAGAPPLIRLLDDPDARVLARALASLGQVLPRADSTLLAQARRFISHEDPAVRSVAADHLGRVPNPADVERLVRSYRRSAGDGILDARLSAVRALGAIAQASPPGLAEVSAAFLDVVPAPEHYLVRRMAENQFPAAAQRWGPSSPVQTGRGFEDYRDLVRRLQLPAEAGQGNPTVTIDMDRGSLTLELLAADATLTVDNFLRLVDQRYFDGVTWHRVVPNFVIQAGDPRGDGWGGPGLVIRDELNRWRYEQGSVGIAHSGPDTGRSQFFIARGPQPHLDGSYTVCGRLMSGFALFDDITQGERIRRIRR